jgi:hypothetical protein
MIAFVDFLISALAEAVPPDLYSNFKYGFAMHEFMGQDQHVGTLYLFQ